MLDRFNIIGEGSFNPAKRPQGLPPHVDKLDPGMYKIQSHPLLGYYVDKMDVKSDEILALPDPVFDRVMRDIRKFWTKNMREQFAKYNLIFKRGILLHGKPGTGKSCLVNRVMEEAIKLGGLVFFNPSPDSLIDFVRMVKEIEKTDRYVLVVLEELERILRRNEHGLLTLLDGQQQMENVVYIATTNYIEDIPERIKKRPSRFCTVLEAGTPNAEARRMYLKHKIHDDDVNRVDLDFWVDQSDGMTIDQLKDMVVNVLCFDHSVEEAVEYAQSFDFDS